MPRPSSGTVTVVDLFCGPGGLSTGFAQACEELDLDMELVAINHDETAIETHQAIDLLHAVNGVESRHGISGRAKRP